MRQGQGRTRRKEYGPGPAFCFAACALIVLFGCGPVRETASQAPNTLTDAEKADGWSLLFDGRTFEGWRGLGRPHIPPGHWVIEDGAILKVSSPDVPLQADGQPLEGGDLMTIRTFEDFELCFEWKISPGGNSGVKYNVSEELSAAYPPRHAALGFEYQVLDDDRHPDARVGGNRTAAALYDLVSPDGKTLRPVGEFNTARIVFRGRRGQHWLNGIKVVEFELGTPDMETRLAASKFRDTAGFAVKRKGHIVLQDHGDAVWFRSIKIREWEAGAGQRFQPEIGFSRGALRSRNPITSSNLRSQELARANSR